MSLKRRPDQTMEAYYLELLAAAEPALQELKRLQALQDTPSVLEARFDSEGYQWEQHNKVYPLDRLSREDLLQVACQSIEIMERMDGLSLDLQSLTKLWRTGEIFPESVTPD